MKTALSAFLLFASAIHAAEPGGAESIRTAARVQPVTYATEAVPVRAAGVLVRRVEVELAFPTAGIIQDVAVRAGDLVAAGDVLARLDLDDIDARLVQARAAAEQARRDAERSAALWAARTIGEEEYENAVTARTLAEAGLRSAEFLRRHAVLEAPAAGRILRRRAEPHQTIAAGQPVLDFAADDGWLVRIAVSDRDLLRLAVGNPARIRVAAQPGIAFDAVVTQIAAGADPRTRTTEVELTAADVPESLRSGTTVHAELQPAPVPARPRVPASALIQGQGTRAAVYLVDPTARTTRREVVDVEALHQDAAYLRTPLPEGALLVIHGAELLRPDQTVDIVPEAGP